MGEVLKFVSSDGGLRKKTLKIFCLFCKNNSILRSFLIKFRFEKPVLSSAQCAQNKHEKNWRAQANDILRKSKKRS